MRGTALPVVAAWVLAVGAVTPSGVSAQGVQGSPRSPGLASVQPPPAQTTGAPPAPAPRFALGALVSAAFPGDEDVSNDDLGPDLAVNADVGIGQRFRIRGEFGRVRYDYDGSSGLPAPLPTERVTITRATVALLRRIDPLSPNTHLGIGVGLYRYGATFSPLPRPTRPGLHISYAAEAPLEGLTVRFEGFIRFIDGPRPAPHEAGLGTVPGRRFSNPLIIFGGGIGIGWNY